MGRYMRTLNTDRLFLGRSSFIGYNRFMRISIFLLIILCFTITAIVYAQDQNEQADPLAEIFSNIGTRRSTADLPAMKDRKFVRALVTLSMTDFFFNNGQPRGIQAEFLDRYEKALNKGVSRKELMTHITFIPVPFSELIPALNDGRGDLVAALMTITPEREKQVTFISSHRWTVNEVLVTNRNVTDINNIIDLSGREIYVLRGSSYVEHLEELNRNFAARMMPPITIVEANENLLSEDLLELVNAGILEMTVIDDFKGELWARIFPDIVIHKDIQINSGGHIGWAIRKDNPELEASLTEFLPQVRQRSLFGNMMIEIYFGSTKWIRNPMDDIARQQLGDFAPLFKEYADQYNFDWLALLAQAYQESGLDHDKHSHAGAVGIMQLLPSTAEYIGFDDITDIKDNIHAGVKYLAFLRERYFSDPEMSDIDRFALTWAAYNAGPAKVTKMRARAEQMGLDPNKWSQNVEYAALSMVGQETVKYVANIYKYYIAYSLSRELLDKKTEQLEAIEKSDRQ